MALAVVNSSIQSSSASSYTLTFPSGAAAGQLAFVFGGHAYNINTPSGWTALDNTSAAQISGIMVCKILSAGDISTGSVTITTGGSYNGVWAVVLISGASPLTVMSCPLQSSTGATAVGLPATMYPSAAFPALYWEATRGVATCTISIGTQLKAVSATEASGCVNFCTASGRPAFQFSSAGSGYYIGGVALAETPSGGGGGGGGSWTSVG